MAENERHNHMIEDFLHKRQDKSQPDSFNMGLRAEQGKIYFTEIKTVTIMYLNDIFNIRIL